MLIEGGINVELTYESRIRVENSLLANVDEMIVRCKNNLIAKRCFDICISGFGLISLVIILILIGFTVRLNSSGPAIFKQVRIGKNGKQFQILKFRTMVDNSENKGLQITVENDSRITRIGRFLRRYKLDELPQLINVLKGDMSFVGPRPEVPKYVALYNEAQRNILRVRPGITDLASIEYRNESKILALSDDPERTYIEEIMPKKFELNVEYLRDVSLKRDINLILKTIVLSIR